MKRPTILSLAVSLISCFAMVVLTPAASASPGSSVLMGATIEQSNVAGYVWIKNSSGKCLEISNSSNSNGAKAQQWDCVGQNGALWWLEDRGGGAWYIHNYSNKCLEISDSSTLNGARAQQWDCVGQAGAVWWFDFRGGDGRYFWIRTVNANKCLEIADSSLVNGVRAQQWDCVGQAGAWWGEF